MVYPFTVIALAVSLLIGDGAAALLSLSLSRNDPDTGRRAVGSALTLSVACGIILGVLGLSLQEPILRLFGVTEGCHAYAVEYMRIISLGVPFYVITNGLNAAIRADGSPAYAMASTVVGAVINLVCDPIAIFVLDWGVVGAAWATILGQLVTAVLALLYFRRPRTIRLSAADLLPRRDVLRKMLPIGLPSLIIQLAIVIIISVANSRITLYGPQSAYGADIPLAVVGIVMKVFGIVVSLVVGISLGGQPIIGYCCGAWNWKRVWQTWRAILRSVLVVGALSMAVFELCPQAVIALFGSGDALYNDYAHRCVRIFLGGIVLTCVQKSGSIFLQAIGKPVQSTLLSLARDVIFFVPAVLICARLGGVTGMLWAAPIADVLAALLTAVLLRSVRREHRG